MRGYLRAALVGLVLITFAVAAGAGLAADVFSDVPADHRFHDEITALAERNIIDGYGDGTFRPDSVVLRAQAAKILVNGFDKHTGAVDNQANPTFRDVVPSMGVPYPFDFVEEAAAAGYFQGRGGLFLPWDRITRVQLALVLARAGAGVLDAPPAGYSTGFTDVPDYARDAVALLKFNQIIDGTSATTFSPFAFATRGHLSKMFARVLDQVAPAGTTVSGRVTDTAGAGLAAHIVISNPEDHSVIVEADTDASGNFSVTLTDHSGGTYVKAIPTDDTAYFSNQEYVFVRSGQANQRNITVSARPPADATYLGSSSCQACHKARFDSYQTTFHRRSIQEDLTEFNPRGWPTADGESITLPFMVAVRGESTATVNPVLTRIDNTHYTVTIGTDVFPVHGTYGGLDAENPTWKQRYLSEIPPAIATAAPKQDYYVLPIQWNENAEFDDPGTPEPELARWVAYKATAWWNLNQSFAAQCSGCHNTAPHYTFNETANGAPVGAVEHYEYLELNVGCEKCHGPGSAHAASPGKAKAIVNPNFMEDLESQEICGQCHSRGDSVEPEGHEYPWNETLGGEYQIGADLMDYSTWTFEFNKDLNPAWYWISTDTTTYPNGYVAANRHHEQLNDLVEGVMPMVKCGQCHDVHGTDVKRNLRGDPNGTTIETNTCGAPSGCHTHAAIFDPQSAHVEERLLTMGQVNYDCSWCHMAETASSAGPFFNVDEAGNYIQGDIANHTFRPIRPGVMDTSKPTGQQVVPDSCNMFGCHADVTFPVSQSAYDAKAAAVRSDD